MNTFIFYSCLSSPILVRLYCREPEWGIQPVAKVMRKEARHMQRRDRASGLPLEILEHLPPKPESTWFTVLCFPPTLLTLTGGCPPPPPFSGKVNLELLDNKSPGHNKSVSIPKPLWWLSSLPDSYSCACDCLWPPHPERHRKLKIIRIELIKGFICWANTCCQIFIFYLLI